MFKEGLSNENMETMTLMVWGESLIFNLLLLCYCPPGFSGHVWSEQIEYVGLRRNDFLLKPQKFNLKKRLCMSECNRCNFVLSYDSVFSSSSGGCEHAVFTGHPSHAPLTTASSPGRYSEKANSPILGCARPSHLAAVSQNGWQRLLW